MIPSNRNHSADLYVERLKGFYMKDLLDWFLYDRDLRHERVKESNDFRAILQCLRKYFEGLCRACDKTFKDVAK